MRIAPGAGCSEWHLPLGRPSLIGRADPATGMPHIDLSPDRSVGRQHAQLWQEDGSWWIKDLESRNGTMVGGRRIAPGAPVRCEPGVDIRIGNSTLNVFGPEWHRLRDEDLVIDLFLAARFGFSLAAAAVRPVSQVVARNWGPAPIAPSQLQVRLADVGRSLVALPRLSVGEQSMVVIPSFQLDPDSLRTIGERTIRAWSVWRERRRVDDGTLSCEMLGSDEWSYQAEHFASLATFVRPQMPEVAALARAAAAGTPLEAGPPTFLQRVYDHLASTWEIDYRRDRPPAKQGSQRLRSAADILWDGDRLRGEGTCLDLAVLIAGALESLRLQPLIAVVDLGRNWHVVVGCWRRQRSRLETLPANREDLLADVTWVDPNGCTRDPALRADYAAACERAVSDLRQRSLVFALDIAAARASNIGPLPCDGQPRIASGYGRRR